MNEVIDWSTVGRAERSLLDGVIEFENEMVRIDRTTYSNENKQKYANDAVTTLRKIIWQYEEMIRPEWAKQHIG